MPPRAVLESLSLTEVETARLTAPSHLGPRLLPTVTLGGLDAVAFFAETVPRLADVPGLDLTVVNWSMCYGDVWRPSAQRSSSTKPLSDQRGWV